MTASTRPQCEDDLRARFIEYRNAIEPETDTLVFAAVDAFVDCLRSDGETPEGVVLAIKEITRGTDSRRIAPVGAREDLSRIHLRIDTIVTHAIERYFSGSPRANGLSGGLS